MGFKKDDQGFTLVELMVVVLVIAILIAIAVPTFLGARQRAQDRAAQTLLRNGALSIEQALNDNFRVIGSRAVLLVDLAAIEPSITWVNHLDDAQESDTTISIDTEPTFVSMASGSDSGDCFYMRIYIDGTKDRHVNQTQPCTGHTGEGVGAPSGW